MDLSTEVVNGLKLVADSSKIPDKCFVILLKNITNILVESKRLDPPHGTFAHKIYKWACPAWSI